MSRPYHQMLVMNGATDTLIDDSGDYTHLTWNGNTVEWYSSGYMKQLNCGGSTYKYLAIG